VVEFSVIPGEVPMHGSDIGFLGDKPVALKAFSIKGLVKDKV
jgi:hypothetical protein